MLEGVLGASCFIRCSSFKDRSFPQTHLSQFCAFGASSSPKQGVKSLESTGLNEQAAVEVLALLNDFPEPLFPNP